MDEELFSVTYMLLNKTRMVEQTNGLCFNT